jgi:DNA replication protein DnaC
VQVSDLFTDDNIPPRMAPWTFETLPASVDPQAREVVQRFVQQLLSDPNPRYRALTLYSHEGGHCKTGLAVSAMKELMQAGWPCVFLNEKDIFTWLQASQDAQQRIGRVSGYEDANLLRNDTFSSSRGARLIRLLEEVKFAVYDDLGTWHGGRNVVRELYGIINNRMNNCLCTIFTSNLDLQGLRSHLSPDGGMRVVDRIGEYSAFYKVEGPNQRKRQ